MQPDPKGLTPTSPQRAGVPCPQSLHVPGELAAEGLVLSENLRTVSQTVNPDMDLDAQAMLEVLERHGSRPGAVFASNPSLTLFRSGALPVKGLNDACAATSDRRRLL